MSELLPILNTVQVADLRIHLDGDHAHEMLLVLSCCEQLLTQPELRAALEAFLDDYDPALDRARLRDMASLSTLRLMTLLTLAADTVLTAAEHPTHHRS